MKNGQLTKPTIILLGLLMAIGSLATDMYLPAFPQIQNSLNCGAGQIQLTLWAWFLGVALGDTVQGPLSDRFGRKIPLLCSMILFTISTIFCAVTDNFVVFCIARFCGALGGCSTFIATYAIVRDTAKGKKAANIQSQLSLVFGLMPMIAPTLGSIFLKFSSWRSIFWFEAVYGIGAIIGVIYMVQNTLPKDKIISLHPIKLLKQYKDIITEKTFLRNTLIASSSMFVTLAYVSGAPFLFEEVLHFSSFKFGLIFGGNAILYIMAKQFNNLLIKKWSLNQVLEVASYSLGVLLTFFFLFSIIEGYKIVSNPFIPVLFIALTIFLTGFIHCNAQVLCLEEHGNHAATATSLLGSFQFLVASFSSIVLWLLPQIGAVPLATTLTIGSLSTIFFLKTIK